MAKKKKNKKGSSQLDAMKSIRKPMPPSTKVINPKKKYDRRDKSWMNNIDGDD
jgi:hypothetical protein